MLRIMPDAGIVLCRCLFKNSNQAAGTSRECVGRARADLGFQSCGGGGGGGTNEGRRSMHLPGEASGHQCIVF